MKQKYKNKRIEEIFEIIMPKNLPKLMSDTKPQMQEAQRRPSRINVRKSASKHNIFKL